MEALVVENDRVTAAVVRRLLDEGRISASTVASLDDALHHTAQHDVDALLLDLDLPDATRLEGLQTLIKHRPELPICILSASKEPELIEEALRIGADEFLIKRADMDRFLAMRVQQAVWRRVREQQAQHSALLERRDRLVRALLNEAAHDLYTPLTALCIMGEDWQDPPDPQAWQRLGRNLVRLRQGVDDFIGHIPQRHTLDVVALDEVLRAAVPTSSRMRCEAMQVSVIAEPDSLHRLLRIIVGIAALVDAHAHLSVRTGALDRAVLVLQYRAKDHPDDVHPARMALARSLAHRCMGRLSIEQGGDRACIQLHLERSPAGASP